MCALQHHARLQNHPEHPFQLQLRMQDQRQFPQIMLQTKHWLGPSTGVEKCFKTQPQLHVVSGALDT